MLHDRRHKSRKQYAMSLKYANIGDEIFDYVSALIDELNVYQQSRNGIDDIAWADMGNYMYQLFYYAIESNSLSMLIAAYNIGKAMNRKNIRSVINQLHYMKNNMDRVVGA